MWDSGIFISTDSVGPDVRQDFWRQVKQPLYDIEFPRCAPAPRFQASMRVRQIGDFLIGQTAFGRHRCVRSKRTIVQGGLDGYLLHLVDAGSISGDYGGRAITALPGDIILADLSKPCMAESQTGQRTSLTIPRHLLERALGQRNVHGLVLRCSLPVTRMLSDFIRGYADASAGLSNAQVPPLQDAMLGLVAAGLTGLDMLPAASSAPLHAVLRGRVLAFIDDHYTEPDLGPDLLMKRFKVSRAHLYRAFDGDGGVMSIIRNKRLDAAFLAITHRTGQMHQTVEHIATRHGFRSHDQFLRAFRARFGMTPGEAMRAESIPFNNLAADALVEHYTKIAAAYEAHA
jgi:AraC-like DNA-binding protein